MGKGNCKLCNRSFNYKYNLFGRNCLSYEYKLLGITKPKQVKNKELYLCNEIAKRLHKTNLNKKQKEVLTERYLTIKYLEKIKYGDFTKEKEELMNNIRDKSALLKISNIPITLNGAYKIYKLNTKFDNNMKKIKNNKLNKDEEVEKIFLTSMKFIFDITKITNPILYRVYYDMQYAFWQSIIDAEYLCNLKVTAKLMQNSLSLHEEISKDIIITDGEVLDAIRENDAFNTKVKYLIEKYGKGKTYFEFYGSDDPKESNIEFNNNYDLLLSIHGGTINLKGNKNKEGQWNLDIIITDTYDFTDWRNIEEIYDKNNKYETDADKLKPLANIFNDLALISMKYGVLKKYKITIKMQHKTY